MNELIKIEEKDGQKLVSARELHEFFTNKNIQCRTAKRSRN